MSHRTPPELIHRFGAVARDAGEALERSGVRRWELFAKASQWREVTLRPGERPTTIECRETGLAVRTRRSGRTGFAAASGADTQGWRRAIESALTVERADPVDPLPPAELLGSVDTRPSPPRPPGGWATHAAESLVRSIAFCSEGHHHAHRVQIREGEAGWVLHRGDGVTLSHQATTAHALIEAGSADGSSSVWRELLPIPDHRELDPESLAARLADRLRLLSERVGPAPAKITDVILDASTAAHLLGALAPMFFAAAGPASARGDEPVAATCLSLSDDRAGLLGPIRTPCDAEGFPAATVPLVRRGRAVDRLGVYRDAIRSGLEPRGGAVRPSYTTPPMTGITNLHIVTDAGLEPPRLLTEADRAVYVLRLSTPPQYDPTEGRLRLAGLGVEVVNGQARAGLVPVRIDSPAEQALQGVAAVGTDLQWHQTARGCVGSPSLLLRGLSVS